MKRERPREGPGRPRDDRRGPRGKTRGGGTMKDGGEGTGASGSNVTSVCLIIAAVIGFFRCCA